MGGGYVAAGDAALVLDPASSHGVLRALLSGMHAARLVGAVLAGGDEARLSHAYSAFVASWFAHDVAALQALYRRLPEPPDWLAAAPGPVSEVAAGRRAQLHASRRVTLL